MYFRVVSCLLLALGLAGCASNQIPAPPNQPDPVLLPAVEPSTISIPVTVDLDLLGAEVVKRLPSPLVQGSVVRDLRININPDEAAAANGEPACSVTSLTCLADRASSSLGHINIDYTAPVQSQIDYSAYLRGLQMNMQGNAFTVTAQIEFSVAARVKSSLTQFGIASCGINEAMPKIEFTLPGTVNWTPAGESCPATGACAGCGPAISPPSSSMWKPCSTCPACATR